MHILTCNGMFLHCSIADLIYQRIIVLLSTLPVVHIERDKTLERLVQPLTCIRPSVSAYMDPQQLAYHLSIDVTTEDPCTSWHCWCNCQDYVFWHFFSSAFNTTQPGLLAEKIRKMKVESVLVSWFMDYLTWWPQHVRLKNCVSGKVLSSIGAPQGTVLSPFLFILCTSNFQ